MELQENPPSFQKDEGGFFIDIFYFMCRKEPCVGKYCITIILTTRNLIDAVVLIL